MASEKQRAAARRKGEAKTRKELNEEGARLEISGRSKMGKDDPRAAIARAK
jgi:hypothetical protein